MVRSAAIVLLLLIVGDAMAEVFALPVPGAALGLATLTAAFAICGGPDPGSEELFDFAAPYFPLFFVPAAVGVVASLDVLSAAWVHLIAAIVFGTGVTLLVTGFVFQWLTRPSKERAKS
jgi:holin-like protein